MDSITQAVLGAAVGEATLGGRLGNRALIIGAVVATIPDLDVLITPFFSSIERISIHRGYSHSILFCIVASVLVSFGLKRLKWTRGESFSSLYIFSFLCFVTHVILDTFTSYGTQLFLPFADWRVSFDSVNIVDPVYTVPLLLGVILSVVFRSRDFNYKSLFNAFGLIFSSLYLLFTLSNKEVTESEFREQLNADRIEHFELRTIPVGVGNYQWYGVAKNKESLFIGKYDQVENNEITFEEFPINEFLLKDIDSSVVELMKWFSKDFYVVAQSADTVRFYNLQCDMQGTRYYGEYKAPTAFYFEILKNQEGKPKIKTGMHPKK